MLRLALGLSCLAAVLFLEVDGELARAGETTRLATWLLGAVAGLALLAGGVREVVAELREARAYGHARRGRFALSPLSWGLVRVALLGALVTAGYVAQSEVEARRADWPPRDELLHLPRPEVLRATSLGYRSFAADLVWLRAIGYFGEHLHTDRKYGWLDRYLDAVIALDPKFRAVYRYAGTVMMYNLRRITRESIERSNHYLEQGYRKFPDDWEFPFMICSNYLFELPRFARDAAEKRRFQETGAAYCREASVLPGALRYLPSMVGSVFSRLGRRQLARQHYRELILRTEDPKIRAQLEESYAALVTGEAARRIEDEAATFFRRHKEGYPYVSTDLFLLLGPRGEAPDAARSVREVLSAGR